MVIGMPVQGTSIALSSRYSLLGLGLLVQALRVAWAAQEVREASIPTVVQRLAALPGLPLRVRPAEAARAAGRACLAVQRMAGGLNSCLTRSLVAAALLSDQEGVVLHLGFRPGGGEANGHAWVSMRGENVTDPEDGGAALTESLRLAVRRRW